MLLIILPMRLLAQCPVSDFSIQPSVCIGEILQLNNKSSNADQYEWDFCLENFSENHVDTQSKVPGLVNGRGYKLVQDDNGNWYGFITSYSGSKIFRLNFGLDPSNVPTVTDLGNPNDLLVVPEGIDIIKHNGNWYGFVGKDVNSSGQIVRLDFGSSLENIPAAVGLGVFGGLTGRYRDIVVGYDGTNLVLLLLYYNSSSLVRVNFRGSFLNSIGPSDVKVESLTGLSLPTGISLTSVCDRFVLHIVSDGNDKIQQINLPNGLFGNFNIDWTNSIAGLSKPFRIKVRKEGNNHFAVVSSLTVPPIIINLFDLDPSTPPQKVVRPDLPTIVGFDFVKYKSKNIIQGGYTSDNFRTIFIQQSCSANEAFSTDELPAGITFNSAGTAFIELAAKKGNLKSVSGKMLTINSGSSPTATINNDNICVGSDITFGTTSSSTIVSWNWDFGDGNASAQENPLHQFVVSAQYTVRVDIVGENGCANSVSKSLKIYDPPISDFSLPSGIICTNNEFQFVNTTVDNFDGNLAYIWEVDAASVVGTERDLNYSFISEGTKDIKLTTSIPGCYDEITKTIPTVQSGPTLDFTYTGLCQSDEIRFTNSSTGDITGFTWDFGDGQSSTLTNPVHTYSGFGVFDVLLEASSSGGCQNRRLKTITIFSKPQPNFQLELPPFSCSGMPSQFTDLTPNPVDSNITSWEWNFGDSGSGTNSTSNNPTHIFNNAGQYEVTLTTGTNYGCIDSLKKTVTIAQTPAIEILNTPACDDLPVTFSTSSSGDLQSWSWQIGITQFSLPEPSYLFTNPGSYNITLDGVGNNNCIASTKKNVIVPQSLVPDFVVEKNCVGQSSEFTDVTTIYDDPIATYIWSFGDTGTGSGSPVNHSYQSTGDYNVNLNITTSSGCNYSRIKNIAVGNPPQASFNPSPDVGVPPLNVNFVNNSSGATHYMWNFNDESNSISTEVSPQFAFLNYGNYVVDLTAYNAQNCSHTVSKVITAALPFIDIGLENLMVSENANGLLTGRVVIHNKGNITVQNLNLLINLSGIEIQQTVTEPIPPYSSILYTLNFNIVNSGKLEYICVEADLAGDNNEEDNSLCTSFENEVVIMTPYPNPSHGDLHIDWISPEDQLAQLNIYDPLGKLVFQNEVGASKGLNSVLLSLERPTQGVYFLTFHSGKTKRTLRFAVNR